MLFFNRPKELKTLFSMSNNSLLQAPTFISLAFLDILGSQELSNKLLFKLMQELSIPPKCSSLFPKEASLGSLILKMSWLNNWVNNSSKLFNREPSRTSQVNLSLNKPHNFRHKSQIPWLVDSEALYQEVNSPWLLEGETRISRLSTSFKAQLQVTLASLCLIQISHSVLDSNKTLDLNKFNSKCWWITYCSNNSSRIRVLGTWVVSSKPEDSLLATWINLKHNRTKPKILLILLVQGLQDL